MEKFDGNIWTQFFTKILADKSLTQVFHTLLENSIRHGQKVTEIKLHFIEENSQVTIFYEDNGVGVSLENKSRIFKEALALEKALAWVYF